VEFYNALLAAYRESPNNHFRAAQKVGCDRQTAKRGWERGWPNDWSPPIKDALKEEHIYLRAARQTAAEESDKLVAVKLAEIEAGAVLKLQEAQIKLEMAEQSAADADAYYTKRVAEAERTAKARYNELLDKAKVDALTTIGEEAQMSSMGRKAAVGSTYIAASFFQNATVLAAKFTKAFANADDWTPKQAMMAAMLLTKMTQQANEAVRTALENERLRLGQPTEILSVQSVTTDPQSIAEMEIELSAVHDALNRIKNKSADAPVGDSPVAPAPVGTNGGSNGAVH